MGYRGIDIYSEDNVYDWKAVRNAGIQLVYIKATDGVTYTNPKVNDQYNGAKAAGLLVGFYHYAEKNNPMDEYNHFMNVISKYKSDLHPVLDYEVDVKPDFNFIRKFMAQNENLILYSYHEIADASGIPAERQWIAEPNTNPSDLRGYSGIQYSWTGRINGISNDTVDLDLFSVDVIKGNAMTISNIDNTIANYQVQLNSIMNAGLVVDNVKGNLTASAIKNFQAVMGLDVDGIVGNITQAALNEILSFPLLNYNNSYKYATEYVQYRLNTTIDGIYGNKTIAAVKNYQKQHGLSVDGIVGAQTWKMLWK